MDNKYVGSDFIEDLIKDLGNSDEAVYNFIKHAVEEDDNEYLLYAVHLVAKARWEEE